MAKSTGKRENHLTPDEQLKDGMSLTPGDNAEPSSSHLISYPNAAPLDDPKEVQNNESSSTREDLPKGQQNNNGNYGKAFDDLVDYILPTP